MKLWVDDVRPAPKGYVCCRSVDSAKKMIEIYDSWIDNELFCLNMKMDYQKS